MGMTGIGLDPVDDQRLAGLIMWIPGGLVHGVAGARALLQMAEVSEGGGMRSLSTKNFFGILAALIFAVALVGIIYKYVEQRERMRVHAALETGGDPRRGEAMFIQYGCGSCHALENVAPRPVWSALLSMASRCA